MAEHSHRNPDGTFQPGHKYARGRPPRNYCIAHALSIAANEAVSVDDNGEPLTNAQLATRWLWRVVREGVDSRRLPDGGEQVQPVATKDRLAALQTILARIEPGVKLDQAKDDEDDAEVQAIVQRLEGLSDEELALLERAGLRGRA